MRGGYLYINAMMEILITAEQGEVFSLLRGDL